MGRRGTLQRWRGGPTAEWRWLPQRSGCWRPGRCYAGNMRWWPLLLAGVLGCGGPDKDGFGIDGNYSGSATIVGTGAAAEARPDVVSYASDQLEVGAMCALDTYPTGTVSYDADESGDGKVDAKKDVEYDHAPTAGQTCTLLTAGGSVAFVVGSGTLVFRRTGTLETTIAGTIASAPGGYVTYRFSGHSMEQVE